MVEDYHWSSKQLTQKWEFWN